MSRGGGQRRARVGAAGQRPEVGPPTGRHDGGAAPGTLEREQGLAPSHHAEQGINNNNDKAASGPRSSPRQPTRIDSRHTHRRATPVILLCTTSWMTDQKQAARGGMAGPGGTGGRHVQRMMYMCATHLSDVPFGHVPAHSLKTHSLTGPDVSRRRDDGRTQRDIRDETSRHTQPTSIVTTTTTGSIISASFLRLGPRSPLHSRR